MLDESRFDDIRPYNDDEVVDILHKLINEKELQSIIANYVMPRTYRLLPWLCRNLVKLSFSIKVKKFICVASLQKEVVKYLNRLIRNSTNGFSYSGLELFDSSKPTLFISNHRDIALDPALVNFALHQAGSTTAEIAIGDNLLTKPWLSDLMRLNKSFIVKRGEKSKRAMLNASKNLSAYIHYTLNQKKQHLWIAQREGRAKDGLDKTNSAVISMLMLNREKRQAVADYLKELNIVPVAISYEFDPCDRDKSIELAAIENDGKYQKSEHEDIDSIAKGLIGYKGKIHVEFGCPLTGEFSDSKAIAEEIDRQIISNYRVTENNQAAFDYLTENKKSLAFESLNKRMEGLKENEKKHFINMYANPVLAQSR
jgi:1-acyl-sn-glycerol-3-phosphate acyltransferase